jgi:hypothetical protein
VNTPSSTWVYWAGVNEAVAQEGVGQRDGLGQLGQIHGGNSKMDFIFEFKPILEFGKTLGICMCRFRRNLDMGIFPKIFHVSQGF